MDALEWNIATVASVIDIAVAPVFLLAGISGLLMVLTNFVTLGLLTMVGAASALGGYLMHRNRTVRADPSRRFPGLVSRSFPSAP